MVPDYVVLLTAITSVFSRPSCLHCYSFLLLSSCLALIPRYCMFVRLFVCLFVRAVSFKLFACSLLCLSCFVLLWRQYSPDRVACIVIPFFCFHCAWLDSPIILLYACSFVRFSGALFVCALPGAL
jgi:hypothetical protein